MKYKFTGQKEVTSIGLYYYGARYYDPATGRFITEDTYSGRIETTQSQNLYVYAMNNPLKYVDPTGHMAITNEDLGGSNEPDDIDYEIYLDLIIQLNSLNANKLLLEIPYLNVNKPSELDMHINFASKTGLGLITGEMMGPLGDSVSKNIGKKVVDEFTKQSIDYITGRQMDKLLGTINADENMRRYLTNEAVLIWNLIVKESMKKNIFIYSYGDESNLRSNIFEVQLRNAFSSLGNYTASLIRGGSITMLTSSSQAGYLIESAYTFYDREFPVSYKKGDIVMHKRLEYSTKQDIEILKRYKLLTYRYADLHAVKRDGKIYQAYLKFYTKYSLFGENYGSILRLSDQEKYHGACW